MRAAGAASAAQRLMLQQQTAAPSPVLLPRARAPTLLAGGPAARARSIGNSSTLARVVLVRASSGRRAGGRGRDALQTRRAASRPAAIDVTPTAPELRDDDATATSPPSPPSKRVAADAGADADAASLLPSPAPSAPAAPPQQLLLAAAPAAAALALALARLPSGPSGFSALAGPLSTLQALSVLAAVIAVHEAGHFAAARSLGVLVSRFCIGFGPTLVSWREGGDGEDEEEEAAPPAPAPPARFRLPWQREGAPPAASAPPGPKPWPRGSVEYALCALPLGGYVAFPEPEDAGMRERQQQEMDKAAGKSSSGGGGGKDADGAADKRGQKQPRPEPTYAPDDPDLLANRPVPQRLFVASAGVAANCAFAFLTLLLQMLVVGKAEYDYMPGVKVPEVTRGGAAERAGLRAGDTLVRVGGAALGSGPGQVAAAVAQIQAASPGAPLELVVLVQGEGNGGGGGGGGSGAAAVGLEAQLPSAPALRAQAGGAPAFRTKTLLVIPVSGPRPPPAKTPEEAMAQPPPSSQIGVSLIANTFVRHTQAATLPEAAALAGGEFKRLGGTVLSGLRAVATDFRTASQQLSGPVAIVAAGSEIARADPAGLYQFCAVVNINLAAVNALPLPGLDGGFAALLAVEAARGGKRVSKGVEAGVMAGGLAC